MNSNIPSNIVEAVIYLIAALPKEDLEKFKNEDPIGYHHGLGTDIRNNWSLWTDTSPLVKWFNNIGIYHADDMSSIVLTSLHRYLLGIEICLEEQVKMYQDYWREQEQC